MRCLPPLPRNGLGASQAFAPFSEEVHSRFAAQAKHLRAAAPILRAVTRRDVLRLRVQVGVLESPSPLRLAHTVSAHPTVQRLARQLGESSPAADPLVQQRLSAELAAAGAELEALAARLLADAAALEGSSTTEGGRAAASPLRYKGRPLFDVIAGV